MSMRKGIIIGIVVIALLSGGAFASHVWASGNQQPDARGLAEGVRSGIGPIAALKLKESENKTDWSPVIGTLKEGYSVALDHTKPYYKYLDVETLTASPALKDGTYDFYFDHLRVPDDFFDPYWSDQGVVEGATDWQGIMWEIINGREPIFYLEVSANGSEIHLLDGLLFQAFEDSIPLRVSQDYPLATYHYGGWVTDVNEKETYINVQMTFTREAGVSLTADSWTIDGCGYLDVYIHLKNMHDLYALDIELSFNATVLEVVDLNFNLEDGINLEPVTGWFDAGYWAKNEADNAAGTIRYAATQLRGADPVQGAGDIAKIRFRAKALADDTPVTITKVEFSDRDGFLVGRPAGYEVPAATITTQFTAAAGLDLDIIRKDASTVQLQWPKPGEDSGIKDYTLHKSKLPYFELGDDGVEKITAGFDVMDDLITYDDAVLGDVVDNWFYALQVACEHDYESPLSWQVGKFEYELFETPTTDLTIVGFLLENPDLVDMNDLGEHIENNIYEPDEVKVLSISTWNPTAQSFTTYGYPAPYPFDLEIKQPYQIAIDIEGDFHPYGGVIWAQVGKLPPITQANYTLMETPTTDFVWVVQPLEMIDIANSSQLAARISADTSGAVSVLAVSTWNGIAQSWTTGMIETRFGYPYNLTVSILGEDPVTWP